MPNPRKADKLKNMQESIKVPPLDLKRQYEPLSAEISSAISRVVASGNFILGDDVAGFEAEVAAYLGVKHAIGVTSGTDALWLALKSLGIKQGDHVLTSPFTFFATVSATVNAGAVPVFADIEADTFNLSPDNVEETLRKDTQRKIKAVIPVHLYGQAADMERINTVAARYGVPVIEDAAQAIGADVHGRKVGGLGQISCFSLFPTKNLGAMGDAGFIATNDPRIAEKARLIRTHGSSVKYVHEILGSNLRMDTLQAAILRVFLPHLDRWITARQKAACYYDEKLIPYASDVSTPCRTDYGNHTFHQYTIRVLKRDRDSLKDFLASRGISSAVYYPIPCHLQKALAYMGHQPGSMPLSEKAAKQVLSLPVFPGITTQEQDAVISAIGLWLK